MTYDIKLTYTDGSAFTESVPANEQTDIAGRFRAETRLAKIEFEGGLEFLREQFWNHLASGRSKTVDGCANCGMAYSFHFKRQFHKRDCVSA